MEDRTNTEIEIGDVESYGMNKDSGFSHQALVMTTMRKALENASKEMKPGWFSNKIDKQGNSIRIYEEDTRQCFISSVEAVLMVMECDLDSEARKELDALIKERENIKKKLNDDEDNEWKSLIPIIKQKLMAVGKGNINGYFNKDKVYYQTYIDECVRIYREIFKVLTKQTFRLDYYQAEIFEA